MAKKTKTSIRKSIYLPTGIFLILTVMLGFWLSTLSTDSTTPEFPKHTIPYVDGDAAVEQVTNFYQQYINLVNKPVGYQKNLVTAYGSKNLEFYYEYYQHGFDPITCSASLPTNVSASLISTGPYATVKVVAAYSDGTSSDITTTVVLKDGIEIDSITCPGAKGNLSPL